MARWLQRTTYVPIEVPPGDGTPGGLFWVDTSIDTEMRPARLYTYWFSLGGADDSHYWLFQSVVYSVSVPGIREHEAVALMHKFVRERLEEQRADRGSATPRLPAAERFQSDAVRHETAIAVAEMEGRAVPADPLTGEPDRPSRKAIPDRVKMFVWQRDGGRCVECGSNENLEFDHIIPVSMGGATTERNLQLLCEPCNRRKGGQLVAGSKSP
jgi:5-methylcytosine-specific restriction endonuclease McrA